MKLLLDVYTSLIFRFSFVLPVSFVYGNYSVRVKRKFFGEVRMGQVGVRAARAIVGLMGGMRRLRGLGRLGICGRVEQVRQTCVKEEQLLSNIY